MKTLRTATIVCVTSIRLFFLDIRYKKTLQELCPMLYKRMRKQIYRYTDETLEFKIKLLRESVCYFKTVERRALVEIAFQMKIVAYQKDTIVLKPFTKIHDLLIVFDGIL